MSTSSVPRVGTTTLPRRSHEPFRVALAESLAAHEAQVIEARATVDALAGETETEAVVQRELADRTALRAQEAIADVEDALARMDGGSYGACERCGGLIAIERLEALPHARHCVTCPRPAPRLVG
jgi:RNA polymerase-binding transcription factor DksA